MKDARLLEELKSLFYEDSQLEYLQNVDSQELANKGSYYQFLLMHHYLIRHLTGRWYLVVFYD